MTEKDFAVLREEVSRHMDARRYAHTLGVEKETELTGAGVSYCALCDGAQSLTPEAFADVTAAVRRVREAVKES